MFLKLKRELNSFLTSILEIYSFIKKISIDLIIK